MKGVVSKEFAKSSTVNYDYRELECAFFLKLVHFSTKSYFPKVRPKMILIVISVSLECALYEPRNQKN